MTSGAAFSDPPNQCIQPFQVATNQRSRLLGAKPVVTCGGLPRGQVSVCLMRIMYVTYMSCVPYMYIYIYTHTSRLQLRWVCQESFLIYNMYMYVHTCYVLIRPPIPYSTSSHSKRLRILRPDVFFASHESYPKGPPLSRP